MSVVKNISSSPCRNHQADQDCVNLFGTSNPIWNLNRAHFLLKKYFLPNKYLCYYIHKEQHHTLGIFFNIIYEFLARFNKNNPIRQIFPQFEHTIFNMPAFLLNLKTICIF